MRNILALVITVTLCTYLCKHKSTEGKFYEGGFKLKNGLCRCFNDEDPAEEPPIPISQGIEKIEKIDAPEHDYRPQNRYESDE